MVGAAEAIANAEIGSHPKRKNASPVKTAKVFLVQGGGFHSVIKGTVAARTRSAPALATAQLFPAAGMRRLHVAAKVAHAKPFRFLCEERYTATGLVRGATVRRA